MSDDVTAVPGGPPRRTVLAGGGAACAAAVLGACAPTAEPARDASALAGRELAKAADVPVGGGTINSALKVVVTQPARGEFKAFDSTCTHQGCQTDRVADGLVECPCHKSAFAIADGSVKKGPAKAPLKEYPVRLDGDAIVGA
ncbi:Rieske (2Fe-2S) protein [Actinomadura flavalba]|uniref:Rieske (2Fe-2S) protein n=1 Tax=Actinomadura flavalba TaxID=1120938 RepID=UPI000526D725|nr:Rieske (2Fe-2S) protein [Actinomadura flavalba]